MISEVNAGGEGMCVACLADAPSTKLSEPLLVQIPKFLIAAAPLLPPPFIHSQQHSTSVFLITWTQ